MDDGSQLDAIRHQLAILCCRKSARTSEWTPDRPTEWRPQTVINPADGQPFTDAGAWEFIAECLNAGKPITEVELRKPPGKKGYEMRIDLAGRILYVKLQLGSGKVIGRSFHFV